MTIRPQTAPTGWPTSCLASGPTRRARCHYAIRPTLSKKRMDGQAFGKRLLHALACSIAIAMVSRKGTAVRQTKMLGAPSGGGRKRAVKALYVRTTAFRKRVPRIHQLRRAGVRTAQLTRAAGTPMVMYGVETVGMADTQLQTTRGVIARAAAPAGGGKSVDHILHAIDRATGTLDPAFDAHVLPIQTWATAWWEFWRSTRAMQQALADAILKLGDAKGSA